MSGMSSFNDVLKVAGPIASIGGTIISARSKAEAGSAALKTAKMAADAELVSTEYEARHQEYLARQAQASSQREAYEQRRLAARLASKAIANAAASGAGASDPDVLDLLSEIQAEGAYRSSVALYEGENEAYNRLMAAQARRLEGSSAAAAAIAEGRGTARAAKASAFSTVLRDASSWIDQYGSIFTKEA